jgi:hypothetical protein
MPEPGYHVQARLQHGGDVHSVYDGQYRFVAECGRKEDADRIAALFNGGQEAEIKRLRKIVAEWAQILRTEGKISVNGVRRALGLPTFDPEQQEWAEDCTPPPPAAAEPAPVADDFLHGEATVAMASMVKPTPEKPTYSYVRADSGPAFLILRSADNGLQERAWMVMPERGETIDALVALLNGAQ